MSEKSKELKQFSDYELGYIAKHFNTPDCIVIFDLDLNISMINQTGVEMLCYDNEEQLLGRNFMEFLQPEDHIRAKEFGERMIACRKTISFESVLIRRDGTTFPSELRASIIMADEGIPKAIIGMARDITERIRAQKIIEESERKYRELVENANSIILHWERNGRIIFMNEFGLRFFGYTEEELIGRSVIGTVMPEKESTGRDMHSLLDAIAADPPAFAQNVNENMKSNGERVWISWTNKIVQDEHGQLKEMLSIGSDITERRRNEILLNRANHALRALSAGNEAVLRAKNEPALLAEMCRVISEVGGYGSCFVAYARDNPEKSVETIASCGFSESNLKQLRLSWGDNEYGRGAVGDAIRTGMPQRVRNARTMPQWPAPWQTFFAAENVNSVLVLPLLLENERPFGVLYISAPEKEGFEEEETSLLGKLADDLVFGITMLRAYADRRLVGEKLRRSLEGTVAAMAATVESRDPYTAGHQRRVAQLATAIAEEMVLPEKIVEGIRFGAVIHDLGKIQVPAELLAKPTRLTRYEFELIKVHPEVGYEIMKDIDFPWPVAEMIRQHHERLDGSGYPQGLKNEEIFIEARVLTVADVVEAMASHRPYRPGLGIDTALSEIEKNIGVWYDADVVNACTRLFRVKSFTFKG